MSVSSLGVGTSPRALPEFDVQALDCAIALDGRGCLRCEALQFAFLGRRGHGVASSRSIGGSVLRSFQLVADFASPFAAAFTLEWRCFFVDFCASPALLHNLRLWSILGSSSFTDV
jgi:hypothetical protein